MAYFKVLSIIKQHPELVVSNIYELDDYEAEVLAQGASGHILEHIMFVSDEFKANSCGLVSFGIRKPAPTSLINMISEPVEVTNNQSETTNNQNEVNRTTNIDDEEVNRPKETNVVAEVINPFYYVNEESEPKSVDVRYSEREKELNALLARDIKDLCDRVNINYKNKAQAVQAILKLEFPDYAKDQLPLEEVVNNE